MLQGFSRCFPIAKSLMHSAVFFPQQIKTINFHIIKVGAVHGTKSSPDRRLIIYFIVARKHEDSMLQFSVDWNIVCKKGNWRRLLLCVNWVIQHWSTLTWFRNVTSSYCKSCVVFKLKPVVFAFTPVDVLLSHFMHRALFVLTVAS